MVVQMGMVIKILLWRRLKDNLSVTSNIRGRGIKDIGAKFCLINFTTLFMTFQDKGLKSSNCVQVGAFEIKNLI